MAAPRTSIQDFSLANPIYVGAVVTIYEADADGAATTTEATLYEDRTGTTELENPQTLDSDGKLAQPVYVDTAVVCEITNANGVPDHSTGVIRTDDPSHKVKTAVTLNSANTDVATFTNLPSKYIVRRLTVFEASTSLSASAATLGLYTAASAGGTAVVTPATLTDLSAATKYKDMTIAEADDYLTASTLYLRNGTAHGSTATVSACLEIVEIG